MTGGAVRPLSGDWGGLRTRLIDAGIVPSANFVGEVAGNATGGRNVPGTANTGTRYAQQIRFGADLDFNRIAGADGLTGHVFFTDRLGRSLHRDVIGNKIQEQEIWGQGQNFRISELSVNYIWGGGLVETKIGFFPFGNDYGVSPQLCNFIANNYCGHVQTLSNNSGWVNAPRGSWATWVKLSPQPSYYLMAGVSKVNPSYTAPVSPNSTYSANGLKMDMSGTTGDIFPVEVGWLHGGTGSPYAGDVKLGGYVDTSPAADVTDSTWTHRGRYGLYMVLDQFLFRETPEAARGLSLVATAGIGDRATAPIPAGVAAGLVYTGPVTGRDQDTVALGWSRYWVNDRILTGSKTGYLGYEQQVELNYGLQLTPWALFRPAVQYVMNPGAFAATAASQTWKDALVFAGQMKLTF